MAPSPIPAPLPAWAKFALRYVVPVVGGYLYDLLTHEGTPATLTWRRVHCVFTRTTPTGTSEDKALCTFDLVNVTGGSVDNTWITADYTTAESAFDTFFTAWAGKATSNHTMSQYRWYTRQFTPTGVTSPAFLDSGPPVRVTAKSIVGTTSGTYLPYQVACSVTEKTAWPKHWGRFYLPGLSAASMDAYGRWASTHVSGIGAAAGTLYGALAAAELFPVVPVTQVDKTPTKQLLGVSQIQVDEIPDVQRSRRPKQALQRYLAP